MAAHYDASRIPPAADERAAQRMNDESTTWPPDSPLRMAPPSAARRTREALDRIDKFCSDTFEDALASDAAGDAQKRLEFLRRRPKRKRRYTRFDRTLATSVAAKKAALLLDNLEQYQPWTDENEVRQYDELADAHGWDKSRFGAYGVTPSRTISRVLDALRKKGARPVGTEVVVLGSSVGWVAFGLSLLLPKASQTVGLEILGTRVYAANVAASILNGVREVCFVLGDVVQEAEAQCRDAALIWDSLGYGAENGGRTEGLAGATKGAKPGCVLVTYDVLPNDSRLSQWKQLDVVVLPNSWTARQRYYLYVLPGGDGPPLSVVQDPRALKYQEMLAKFRNRDLVLEKMKFDGVDAALLDPPRQNALSPLDDDASLLALLNSHEGFAHADRDTPDGAKPEEDMSNVCADFAKVLGTDSIRGFL